MKIGHKRILSATQSSQLKPARFKQFDRRPANYYRDIIVEDEAGLPAQVNHEFVQEQVEEAVARERQTLKRQFDLELQRQHNAGMQKGRAEATGELHRALELFDQYAHVLLAEKEEIAAHAETTAIELAFQVAEKILGAELAARPEGIADVVRAALKHVLDCDQLQLRVHPDDLAYLKAIQADLAAMVSGDVKFEIRADEKVQRGGAIIETERGLLDAQVASQLDTLHRQLVEAGKSSAAQ